MSQILSEQLEHRAFCVLSYNHLPLRFGIQQSWSTPLLES